MEYKKLRHSQVILDRENPRLPDGTTSDKEAINRLLSEGYEQLLALARDMIERGESNPTELPIVVKDGGKYLVLEGNRRFAALKLLADPKLADEIIHQSAFSNLKGRGNAPTMVQCAVAKEREQADHWIMLRHTGANDGVGVRRWSAAQTATHRRRMRVSVDSGTLRSLAIADELTEAYQVDDQLVDLIKRVRAEKLTNIGRFFSAGVLARMQFEIREVSDGGVRTLWARHTAGQLHPFFTWAMNLLNRESVDSFKNQTLRDSLLNARGELLPDLANALPELRRLANYPYSPRAESEPPESEPYDDNDDGGDASGGSPSNQSTGEGTTSDNGGQGETGTFTGGRKQDQRPERHLYSQVKLPNLSTNAQRLLRETRSLPIDDNYAIACVLARVIVELAVSDSRVLSWSGASESDSLAKKIKLCIRKLDPGIEHPRKRARTDLVQAHQEADGLGVAYMHQFMHNPSVKPDPHLARRFSHAFTPLLLAIDEAVK